MRKGYQHTNDVSKGEANNQKGPPHRCRGRYQHQATGGFSDIMTPSRFEQVAPLTPVISQTTSGAECLGKYLGTGGEGLSGC
jgi:hypothetical protein